MDEVTINGVKMKGWISGVVIDSEPEEIQANDGYKSFIVYGRNRNELTITIQFDDSQIEQIEKIYADMTSYKEAPNLYAAYDAAKKYTE